VLRSEYSDEIFAISAAILIHASRRVTRTSLESLDSVASRFLRACQRVSASRRDEPLVNFHLGHSRPLSRRPRVLRMPGEFFFLLFFPCPLPFTPRQTAQQKRCIARVLRRGCRAFKRDSAIRVSGFRTGVVSPSRHSRVQTVSFSNSAASDIALRASWTARKSRGSDASMTSTFDNFAQTGIGIFARHRLVEIHRTRSSSSRNPRDDPADR